MRIWLVEPDICDKGKRTEVEVVEGDQRVGKKMTGGKVDGCVSGGQEEEKALNGDT